LITAKFISRDIEGKQNLHCEIYNKDLIENFIVPDFIQANRDYFNKEYNNRITGKSDFDNELYFYFYLKYINNIHILFYKYSIRELEFVGRHDSFEYIKGYCHIKGIKFKKKSINDYINYFSIVRLIKAGIILFSSAIYASLLPLRYKYTYSVDTKKPFSLIHSKSSYRNISNVFGNNMVYYYDPLNQVLSDNGHNIPLFSLLNIYDTISNLVIFPLQSVKLFLEVVVSGDQMIGRRGSSLAALYFARRIPHYVLVKACYKKLFSRNKSQWYYSGEKESRYGVLAHRMGKMHGKNGAAIPHGMAYAYKYPLGLFGDKYYCLTEVEANYLSNQYDSNKYIFDADITRKMYSFNKNNSPQMVIYFTEPRNIQVNHEIIKALQAILPVVNVQLHPLDNTGNYSMFHDIVYMTDYPTSISGNICLARMSTILLEALYNDSIAISVLFDRGDKYEYENTFPSLQSDLIRKIYGKQQLTDFLRDIGVETLDTNPR
jgi:hypothetical protein